LPYYYQEFVVSMLDAPLYFVRGNHDKLAEHSVEGIRTAPLGGTDLHGRVARYRNLLLAGVEGCLRYREGPFMYSQTEMWVHVMKLIPGLLVNKSRYGRYLDVFVTHAPPQGIHDRDDLPHRGIHAFRWLIDRFQPTCYLHGHTHIYRPDAVIVSNLRNTRVINTYGYRETVFQFDADQVTIDSPAGQGRRP
jgi:Icc-related predicted phosphoesterase